MISRRAAEIAFAGATGLFGGVVAFGATEFGVGWSPSGPQPGTFPFYVGIIIALASLGNLVAALLPGRIAAEDLVTREQLGRIGQLVGPIVGFVVATLFLGLYVATALYMFFVMRVQGRYPTWHSALVAVGLPVALFLILEKGFQVPLLKGPLEAALGL